MVNVRASLQAEQSRIDAAVLEAEANTTGEIIIAHARRAGNYTPYEMSIGITGGLCAIGLVSAISPSALLSVPWSATLLIVCLALGFGLAYLSAPLLLLWMPWLIPGHRRIEAAEEKAVLAFHRLHVANTRAHTGVLIFIAERERTVVVLGDGPIAERIINDQWQNVRDAVLEGIRSGSPADGVIKAAALAGQLLAEHFPSDGESQDELPNTIRFIG